MPIVLMTCPPCYMLECWTHNLYVTLDTTATHWVPGTPNQLQCVLYTPANALFTSVAVVVVVSRSCTRRRHRDGRASKKGSFEVLLHLYTQGRVARTTFIPVQICCWTFWSVIKVIPKSIAALYDTIPTIQSAQLTFKVHKKDTNQSQKHLTELNCWNRQPLLTQRAWFHMVLADNGELHRTPVTHKADCTGDYKQTSAPLSGVQCYSIIHWIRLTCLIETFTSKWIMTYHASIRKKSFAAVQLQRPLGAEEKH